MGVNVSVIFPLNPAGLKLLAETPDPDQLPVIPLCVVGNEIGAAVWHSDAGIPVIAGVTGMLTIIFVVAILAHWPAVGVNVSVIFPLRPAGLKLFPATPMPDQFPVMPLCVVGKETGALF